MLQLYTHVFLAFLSLASAAYLLFQKSSFRIGTVYKYFLWFLLFFLYNTTLAVSAVLFSNAPFFAGVGYRIALFFLALGAWQAFVMGLVFLAISQKARALLSRIYLWGVLVVIGLHIIFFELPKAASKDWVFWYSNRPISLLYTLFMFLAGWTVAFAVGKSMLFLEQRSLRLRSAFLALAAFLLPFAAFLYFGADKIIHVELSLWIVGIALVFFFLGNAGIGLLRKRGP